MAKRVITFELSPDSIDDAIKQIYAYKKDFEEKCARLRQRVAERIRWSAEQGFSVAMVSDYLNAMPPESNVTVSTDERGENTTVVIADGTDAVFIEFGAGIYYNGGQGAVGNSTHPWGVKNGFTIGSYGQGHGSRWRWYFKANQATTDGSKYIATHGTPAAMPMFRGAQEAIAVLQDIVEEVFGK